MEQSDWCNKITSMGNSSEGGDEEEDHEQWVNDSSVDHKGRLPLRAATGSWKAAMFIILIEFSERLSYFGLATSLIIYLTKVLHQEVKVAARNVNYWQGVTTSLPLLGGFLADAYLGRFSTVLVSSLIYLAGLILLAMSQLVPSLKPCSVEGSCHRSVHLHETIFFVAIYMISIGTSGHKPSLESFGADQFDDGHTVERVQKMSYFNWWNCALCSGVLLGVTLIVYIQDKVGWGAADIVLTCVMGVALLVFLVGWRSYRYRAPRGSPLTPLLQAIVAAARKRHLELPDADELYEVKPQKIKRRLLCHTNKLRFLDKAAIVEHKEDEAHDDRGGANEKCDPWRLATVTQVEETKLVLAMAPIWAATLPFGICVAQVATFFIKQGAVMDRKLSAHFELPPASVFSLAAVGMIISVALYDKVLEPSLRRFMGGERGISILKRIGIGMAFSAVAMAVAATVEQRRLSATGAGEPAMSVFWLVPQFMLMGFGDGFALVGLQEYFYDQVPDSMRSLGIGIYLSVIGAGSFLSSLLITAVDHITARGGRQSWFAADLNRSRLDLFYWLVAGLSALNLCWYVFVATRYSYKTVRPARVGDDKDRGDLECANYNGAT